ncbi:zinc-binding dehydrogenase [Paenibacillus sp. MZ04-78.2]|uniref:zinc-binding dehydrogenase n=1 Tax=Paenibacillus sp. MZ04-78.2 TaxID=2962034 RepID=UPI0020B749B9|nr:zinc-binding dehydrogenase [Paenibacillus sp. MZ04-78.2]MCP3774501.1 zinc-binding dehydrogenase [Paenibacillus sp. MZ04-78.2]
MEVLTYTAPYQLIVETIEELPLKPGECRIQSLYSGISHGTEMGAYRGIAPYFTRDMDSETRLFEELREEQKIKYPIRSCEDDAWFIGYSNVGKIIEVGPEVEGFSVGDIVFSHGRHQSIVCKHYKKIFKLPEGLHPELGIFYTNLMTAYNAVLDTRIKIGDVVVVSGLGVVGQLIAQLVKLSGATVVGVDPLPNRLEIAKENAVDYIVNPGHADVAKEIRKITNNRGADAVFEVSGHSAALNQAIRIAAPDTVITAVGWYQGEHSVLNLSEEFHQNRITIRASQTLGIDPSISHMYDDARRRNIGKGLLSQLRLHNLISHRIPFRDAPKAYEMIDKNPQQVLQVVLTY